LLPYFWKRTFPLPFFYALGACVLAYTCTQWRTSSMLSLESSIEGEGIFHIQNLSVVSSPFHRSYCYKGILESFRSEEGTLYRTLRCSIFYPLKQPPLADKDYIIK